MDIEGMEIKVQEDDATYLNDTDMHAGMEVTTIVELGVDDVEEVEYEEIEAETVTSSNTSERFKWSTNNTKLLVKAYFDRRHRFRNPKTKKMDLWEEISQEYGFPVNMNDLTMKWRNMKKTYTLINDKLLDGSLDNGVKWEHYEIFDLLYMEDDSTVVDTGFLEAYFADLEPLDKTTIAEVVDEEEREVTETSNNYFQKFEWTPLLVKLLFKAYFERLHLFKEPKKHQVRKKDLWHDISLDLNSAGYSITVDGLNAKWRNLNFRYRVLKEKSDQGTLGQGVRWEYYDLFEMLYGEDESKIDADYLDDYFAKLESENDKEEGWLAHQHFSWCPLSTDFLLKSYLTKKESFRDPTIRKKKLWTEIWKDMISAGFPVPDKYALDKKMRNLKKTYKDYKITKGSAPITWAYYDRLDLIFSDDPVVLEETSQHNAIQDTQEAWTSESEVELENDKTTAETSSTTLQYQWCPRSTKFFLKSCIRKKTLFQDPNVLKRKLWNRILEEMNIAGFPIKNTIILDTKMQNMTKTYKTIKEKNEKNTTGRGLIRWEHLAAFEKLYSRDEKQRPVPVVSEKSLSPIRTSPSPTLTQTPVQETKRKHSDQMNSLHNMRKKQLLVEEKKAELTEKVHESLKETNKLLRERNELLRKLIDQRVKQNS